MCGWGGRKKPWGDLGPLCIARRGRSLWTATAEGSGDDPHPCLLASRRKSWEDDKGLTNLENKILTFVHFK